ncbi:MAG: MFS transporter [Pseudomonadota bacterium]
MAKPRRSFWQIWNMCFGFFGIQVGFALQNANVSRIFQSLGADMEDIPILWIAAPLTGLLVQPVIGYMSDRTWGRMGRRRPYFFYGALATTLALIIMPNSPVLWMAAGMLWIMDASINVTMEPFRAFVGDMLPDEQRTMGFALQSFFIGSGAVLASALPWILTNVFDMSNIAGPGEIPPSVTLAFYIGAVLLFCSVMWTVFSTKEYSPEELAAFEAQSQPDQPPETLIPILNKEVRPQPSNLIRNGWIWLIAGGIATLLIVQLSLERELFILSSCGAAFGLMQIAAGIMKQKGRTDNPFAEIVDDMWLMPSTMRRLAIVQFFSWFALFSMWIYATPGVTAFHFGSSDTTSAAYNEGADWIGLLFAAYNGFAALAALALPWIAKRLGRKQVHALCLIAGALGFASFVVIKDPIYLMISMIGIGIAWASILSVPYAILSGALPPQKMGVYMGIFNFFIVIPQLLAASVLGLFVKHVFGGEAIYALALGGGSLILAACATLYVRDTAVTTLEAASGPAKADVI